MYPHRFSRRALRIAAREPQRKLILSGSDLLWVLAAGHEMRRFIDRPAAKPRDG